MSKEKILFFRPDHIGDLLLTTPAIHSLKKSFPEVDLTIAVGSWSKDILKYNPYIDNVFIINLPSLARGTKTSYFEMIKRTFRLRKSTYDHIFSFRIAAKSAVVSLFLGGKKRWGFDVMKSKWAFTEKIHYDKNKHVVENYLNLIESFGAKRENNGLEIFIKEEERLNFEKKFNLPENYVIISPGAGYSPKLWVSERWSEIANWLNANINIPFVFTGIISEEFLINAITSNVKGTFLNLCGMLSLRELAILMERSKLLLTVDSAAMHLAVATKTPVIALFGYTNPDQWGPYPKDDKYIVLYKRLKNQKSEYCMKNIQVEDVRTAVSSMLMKNII